MPPDVVPAPAPSAKSSPPLLEVRGLCIDLAGTKDVRSLVGGDGTGVDFEVAAGESVGLVGDSGSGKTLTALSLMGLLPPTVVQSAGTIDFAGSGMTAQAGCAIIFQEPRSALNPLFSIGYQIGEVLQLRGMRGKALRDRGLELLEQVAMPDPESRWRSFPHELSGGQCQRVMIAMALAAEPRLLIADEPTTALDVSVQAQILSLLSQLQDREGLALLMISHDLALIGATCDRLLVMDRGLVVERGAVEQIFSQPESETSRRLLGAAMSQT